jgi:cell division transport system permease protein
VSRLRWVGAALFGALAAGAAVLVSNTLRLGVFARRDEIEIMKLVGATDAFVEAPFLIEGLVQGVLGGALASGALLGAAGLALPRLEAALGLAAPIARGDLVPFGLLGALVAGGGALGTLASALAVGRELRQQRP